MFHRRQWINAVLAIAVAASSASSAAQSAPGAKGTRQVGFSPTDPFCGPQSAEIMILGTYHFANPGLDGTNVEADDVRTPRRQAELEALADRLARFAPTKIMVEAPHGDPRTQQAYRNYLAGKHQLSRNETEQIGFRLAKKLNHSGIYPVDFQMRMSGLRPDELDDDWQPKATAQAAPAKPAPGPRELTADEKLLRAFSITQTLFRINDPIKVEGDHSRSYLHFLLPEDSPAIYAQSDYLTNWYKRNLRMFANVARHTRFPDDKVLVIAGSGHLKIMRDLAREAPYFCLVEAQSYLAP